MAKDTSDQTVPIYNPDGSLLGYTTPEKYEQIKTTVAESGLGPTPEFEYSTGFSSDNQYVKVFNPLTNDFDVVPTGGDWQSWNPKGDNTNWIYHPEHGRVLMRTDVKGWEDTGARVYDPDGIDGGWLWGAEPYVSGPTPIRNGMGEDGGQIYDDPVTQPPTGGGTPPPTGGGGQTPTDDWPQYTPPGYENVPPPLGDGEFVPGGPPPDTSWDWDYFREKAPGDRQWGGYDTDYQAFERYQPGMESPWGMPNITGNNLDFYQQQFVNLLRDEQGFRNRQRAAQLRAAEAAENPYEAPPAEEMWKWAYGGEGVPDVKLGTGRPGEVTYSLADQFNQDSTFGDMIRYYAGQDAFSQYADRMRNWLGKHPDTDTGLQSTYWAKAGDPNKIISTMGNNPEGLDAINREWLTKMANAIYTPGELGPYAPTDYASPVQWGGAYPTGE